MSEGDPTCSGCQMREQELADLRQRVAAIPGLIAEKERAYMHGTQEYVDGIVHYRNLAIALGAKPTDMLTKGDRALCEQGLNADGQGWSLEHERAEAAATWRALESAEEQVQQLRDRIRQLEAAVSAARRALEVGE